MTPDELASTIETVARLLRLRGCASPLEAVNALAATLGVPLGGESSARQSPTVAISGARSSSARAAGLASAAARRSIFGSAQPRTKPERSPNEVAERTPNVTSGGIGGSDSGPGSVDKEANSPEESEDPDQSQPVGSGARSPNEARTKLPNEVTERSLARSNRTEDAKRVFAFWSAETGRARAKFDDKRCARICKRFSEGFSADDLMSAIGNRVNDPFLMGGNDTARVYDGIETLLRDAAQVERLMALSAPAVRGLARRRPGDGVNDLFALAEQKLARERQAQQ